LVAVAWCVWRALRWLLRRSRLAVATLCAGHAVRVARCERRSLLRSWPLLLFVARVATVPSVFARVWPFEVAVPLRMALAFRRQERVRRLGFVGGQLRR
jgi:hypothetical protein